MCYLIGQSAIWRSVLSLRFNKIQTHKTVTIYPVYLLLSILLIQSVSPAQNIADTKGGTASSLALGLMHGLQLAGVHQNLRLPCNLGCAIMQSHPKHIFWPGSLTWVHHLWLIQTDLPKLVVIPTKLGWMSKWLGADIGHNKVLGRMGGWAMAVLWSLRTITGSISGRGSPTSDRSSDQWWLWWWSSSS